MAKKYSKLFSNASASAKYNNILDAAYGITDAKQLSSVRAQIAAFTSELKANNLASQSLGDKWKSLIDRAKDLFSAASAVTLIFSQVKQAVSSFLQLDTAMTNLYKVQDQITSRDQFSGLLTKWNKLAQNLAVTTNSLISSMEAWSKIGFDLDMSEQLAEITSIFEKTAEISNEKATSTLISAAQAFTEIDDLGVDDYVKRVEAVGNKINAIGNKYSIDSEGIADGLQNASAALKVAGNDLNETIALITATNKIYQNPDEGSNMLKVASMRLRGQVDALKEMGEDAEGVSTDLTKIQQQVYELTGNKVNIFEDDENLKSTYQMILEIGEVFDSLNDRSQADLLEVMFGKQRASAGASLLLNYEELEKIKNDSINSANSMAEEYSKYMESAEASLTIFKEKLVETYSTFMSGDLIKYTADIGSGLLDLVNATDLLRHGLVGIVSLNIGKGITSIGASVAATVKQMNTLGNALQQVKSLPVDSTRIDVLEQIGKSTKSLTEKNLKLLLSQKQLEEQDKITILTKHKLTEEEAKLKLEKMGLLSVTKTQTAANVAEAATTGTLKNAMLSLKTVAGNVGATIKGMFASNPIGMWFMVISTGVSMLSAAISKTNEKLEESRRANIESATTASENADKLKDLYNEYTRLASIQDRTTSEEEAFKTAVENITVALGDKAEILKDLTADTDEYTNALARATKEELQSQAVTATIGRKASQEELQDKIWDKWGGSQVTIDSNDKGQSLSDEAQKAVDIVSESLKEFETVNRTWKNISWDISSDDPTQALEYYNSLIEAREKLVLASENDESLLDTEIYEDLNTAINSMSESLDTYIEKLYEEEKLNYMAQNGIPSVTEEYKAMETALVSAAGTSVDLQNRFKELLTSDFSDLATDIGNVGDAVNDASVQVENISVSFEDAWSDSFTSESDAVRELGNTLLGLAEKGRLTKETFNEADSTVDGYFKNLGVSADEAVAKINKLVDESSQLSSMSSQISSMAEALGTKQENGFVEADTLSGFDVEVRGLESWDRFQEVLGSTASSYRECQEAANALATEWVNSSDFLAQLTEQNEEYYKTQLESMGIENYEELISYAHALNEAKEVLSQSSLELGNATYDEIEALIAEGTYSELTANMILALYDAKIAEQAVTIDTAADCENLIALAGDTDRTSQSIQLLIQLMNIYNSLESGVYDNNVVARAGALATATAIKSQLEALANGEVKGMEIEPTVKLGSKGKSSAKSAGKDAGKSYKDGLKEELNDLNSVISGITGRIDDQISTIRSQKEAALESIDAQIDALNEQKSALEAQKKALEEARDAAVEALEEERDARIEVIEQQQKQLELAIKSIDKQIKQKEKVIKSINDEIKAMQDANAEKRRQIDLQKAMYELERLQHQRTILQYSEGMGMHYVTDSKNIRDQKDKVDDAKLEIEIANKQKQIDLIEKEIDLLNEKKDAINEQIDLLDEQIEKINEYYDKEIEKVEKFYDEQIKAIDAQIESIDKQIEALQKQREQTEKYYESLIENLEKSKSKYEELTELVGRAELSAALQKLGIDEEALLNGSEEEFQKLKAAYMDVVFKLNEGNDEVLSALQELSGYNGTAPAMLEDSNGKLDEMNGKLDTSNQNVGNVNNSLGETATTTSNVTSNVTDLNANLSETSTIITTEQTAFDTLQQKIDEVITAINEKITATKTAQATTAIATTTEMVCYMLLKEKILEVKESLDAISNTVTTLDATPVNNLTTAFQLLYNQLLLVSTTLGAGMEGAEEGAVGGIASAIQALNEISLEDGIIAQFTNLKTAVDEVTAAIGGGGGGDSESSSGGEGSGGSSGGSKSGSSGESGGGDSEGEGGGGGSLTDAITQMGETAGEVIGEPDAEGDGTVIGEFGALETAVNDVTAAIGSADSEGGEGSGEGEDGNLIGSIIDLGDTTEEELGESGGDGIIGRFEEFRDVIEDAAKQVASISDGLDEIDGKEVECTITINIKVNGDIPAFASGTVLGNMQIESATYNAKYGKAFANGTIGLPKAEKNALVSEYGQTAMTVLPDGKTIVTDTPTMMNLPKDTVIYNEEQTKKILSNKIDVNGTAHANGTADDEDWFTAADGTKLRPHRPGDRSYDLCQKIDAYLKSIDNNLDILTVNASARYEKDMTELERHVTNNVNNVTNNRNVQPVINQNVTINCPNVTNDSGVENIQKQLGNLSLRAYQEPLRDY